MVGSPLQGIGAPSRTSAAHKPNVLSQTLLPPAFAPEITKQRAWSVPSAASLPLGSGPPAALRLRARCLFSRPRDSSLSGESRRRRREKVEDVADADSAQREHGVARVAHF